MSVREVLADMNACTVAMGRAADAGTHCFCSVRQTWIAPAYYLGLVPLVIASGAGAATQRAVGTAVFGGMIAASCLGIFVIPGLYVVFQQLREKLKGSATRRPAPSGAGGHSP
jgi:hypothetical protein